MRDNYSPHAALPTRTSKIRLLLLVLTLIASTVSIAISAPSPAHAAEDEVYPLVFPVVGRSYFSDTFGACRDGCSRSHKGTDILTYGVKGLPIVAAHDGVIRRTSTALGRSCCAIWGLTADDGWETWYIHLNNDTPGTDDGKGWGFAPGIEPGVRVTAGQLIGWIGDSGNAERVSPQLHFELRRPDGSAANPYPSLAAATRIDLPRLAGADRFATAAEIALDSSVSGSRTVFVTTGRAFPDALAAGVVSASTRQPVLLTETDNLPQSTRTALTSLQPDRIVIIGGPAAVSDAVATSLSMYGSVERFGGINRYETATLLAENLFEAPQVVYLTYGYSYPEAVSAAVAASIDSGPLLLTDDEALNEYTRRYLETLTNVTVVIVGDDRAVSQAVFDELEAITAISNVTRISDDGPSRTSIAVSRATFPEGASRAYLATADDYADALSGASLAGANTAPVLLLSDTGLDAVLSEVERLGVSDIVILGGPDAVPYEWVLPFWSRSVGNTMPTWK